MGWVLIVLIMLAAFGMFRTFTRVMKLADASSRAWPDVAARLEHRRTLVPDLVQVVKAGAPDEHGLMESLMLARNCAMSARSAADVLQAESALAEALRDVSALTKTHPGLAADATFLRLQAELSSAESAILAARTVFNGATQTYNRAVRRFPALLFSTSFGFVPRPLFDLEGAERSIPRAPRAPRF